MKTTLRIVLYVISIAATLHVSAQEVSIIPRPVQVSEQGGTFTLSAGSVMVVSPNPSAERIARYFNTKLSQATGYTLPITRTPKDQPVILNLNERSDPRIGKEGYMLMVEPARVQITANTPTGLFYGVQSLLQLMPKEIEGRNNALGTNLSIPCVSILDYPRFSWRGMMLDVSRHFFSKEQVKNYIDQMARYKFNRLHLHLTDDNGWRLEIKSLPKLTEVGAWRVPRTGTFNTNEPPKPGEKPTYGGFYTHEDIREMVQYAQEQFIEIVPEIDVPGHSMAALAAYPELSVTKDPNVKVNPGTAFATWHGNGKFEMHIDNTLNPTDEKVYTFLDKVFTEVAQLFPFEYIHMGGDECYKGYWLKDPNVQAFMTRNKIKNGEELQSYFNKRVSKIITDKKKKMIGWDEILEGGLASGAAVMSWRGTKGAIEAAHQRHPVVMSPSPMYYLDLMQGDAAIEAPVYSISRLKDTYAFEPLPADIDSTLILGGQGNVWTEQIPTVAQLEYMTFPRALAIAESMWSHKSKKEWSNFTKRVDEQFMRFDIAGVNYSTSMYDPIITVRKNAGKELTITVTTEVDGLEIYYTVDNSIPNQYHPKYTRPVTFPQGADNFRVITYRAGKPVGRLITLKAEDLEKRAGN